MRAGLLLVAGVAASIPGMLALSQLKLPVEAQDLFPFVLAAFSGAAVLIIFILRGVFAKWSDKVVVAVAIAGLAVVLLSFIGFTTLVNRVWVVNSWRAGSSREFVPLFLPDSAERLIQAAGSRSQLLSTRGADALVGFTTETNLAGTFAVLLLCYTLLVVSLATVFTLLYIRADSSGESPS
jgi:hypothetical protein